MTHTRNCCMPGVAAAIWLARELFTAALAIYRDIGAAHHVARIQKILSEPEPAISASRGSAFPDGLTEREVEVLRLIAAGRNNREIAEELVLSVRTVERHITNIYGKINARGKADATAYAMTHGLIAVRS
jgi:DNA-binding NarL/FixJ family response regulator